MSSDVFQADSLCKALSGDTYTQLYGAITLTTLSHNDTVVR